MTQGKHGTWFYAGWIGGGLLPLVLFAAPLPGVAVQAGAVLALIGIYLTEFVRIRTPQLISLI